MKNAKININFILIILFCILYIDKYENFCLKCIKNSNKTECLNCTNNVIFNKIRIYDEEETLNEIIFKNKSIARFGDGEFLYIFGKDIGFQKYNKELAQRLLNILNSKQKNLLIGITLPYKQKNLNRFNYIAKKYYKSFIKKNMFQLAQILKKNEYFSTTISRFYIDLKSKKGVPKYIKKLKRIWDKKDVVIVEGEKSRLGIGNDLFDNMKSIQRILCPVTDAFNSYNDIINIIIRKVNKNKLILIALGPTATVLSYDLNKLGYQAIDIGHADIEYEWYLCKAKGKISIKNKYVNESGEKNKTYTNVADKNYYKQIIAKIIN